MSNFLNRLLEEIKQGKRKDFSDFYLTTDDYLSVDENGKTFLEKILKLGIVLNYGEEEKLYSSIEAAYIFVKYNKFIRYFEFEEDELFSKLNDIRYIDYFAEKNSLTSKMVKTIENHIDIVDILIKYNKILLIGDLSSRIIKKLLMQNRDGTYPLEKYLDNKIVIAELIKLVYDSEKLIEILKKNNRLDLLKETNHIVSLYKINDSETILEYLYNKNIIHNSLIKIPRDTMFINFLREKKLYEYLKNLEEDLLLLEDKKGKTLLEEIIENRYIPVMKLGQHDVKTIKILYKLNRLDIAQCVTDYILVKSVNEIFGINSNQTVLEYMLDLGCNPIINRTSLYDEFIIKTLYDRGFYIVLGKVCGENKLLIEIESGITIIDKLIEKNIPIKIDSGFSSPILAQKLYDANKIDLLAKGKLEVLLNFVDSNKTYLDYILESVKAQKIKFDLTYISLWNCSVNDVARFYLTLAKHDMIPYVYKLTEDELFKEYNGKTLLDELLDLDSMLTLNKIIPKKVKSNMRIAIILKSRGLEQKNIDIPLEKQEIPMEYLEEQKTKLFAGPLLEEGEFLINKLNNLFISDQKSDLSLVEALINAYRDALFVDYNLAIKELRNLVEIKEKNIDKFLYKLDDEETYFNGGSVYSQYPIFSSILHETGHALHSYLTNFEIPKEYNDVVNKVRQNENTLKKVETFSKKYSKIRVQIEQLAQKRCEKFFEEYYTEEKIKNIELFLEKSKHDKKEEFSSLGLSENDLQMIIDENFTVEEYINHQKRIYIEECKDFILRNEFNTFGAIGDVLDAIYRGKLNGGVLENSSGEKIEKTSGHGIPYYSRTDKEFEEMVANFSSIVKSKDSKEMLDLLKYLIGDELYNLLSKFYYTNIVDAKYEEESKKTL